MPFMAEFITIVSMLVITAVFVAFEMGIASISRARLAGLVSQKKRGAVDALYMKEHIEATFAVCQLGITVAGAIAAATGGAGIEETLAPYLVHHYGISDGMSHVLALICLVVPLSGFTVLVAELVPKIFALNHREFVCLRLSPLMKTITVVSYPLIGLFEQLAKFFTGIGSRRLKATDQQLARQEIHELNAAASLARTARLIGAREEKIVLSAAQLSTRPISDIMIPASEISMIPAMSSLTDALIKAHLDMHTRFPVATDIQDPQTIVGYVNFKDIVFAMKMNPNEPTIKGITRSIPNTNVKTPISQVLGELMQTKNHIALVVDDNKKIVGLVALEDILEELIGEIEDEFDRLPTYVHPYGGAWIMGGGAPMNMVASVVGLSHLAVTDPTRGHVPTLSEWCVQKLGRPLTGGEVIDQEGLHVVVRKLRRKKLAEAVVSKV